MDHQSGEALVTRLLVGFAVAIVLYLASPPLLGLGLLAGLVYLLRRHQILQALVGLFLVIGLGGLLGGGDGVLIVLAVLFTPVLLLCLLPLRVDILIGLVAYLRGRNRPSASRSRQFTVTRAELDELVNERHAQLVHEQQQRDGTYDRLRERHQAWRRGVSHEDPPDAF